MLPEDLLVRITRRVICKLIGCCKADRVTFNQPDVKWDGFTPHDIKLKQGEVMFVVADDHAPVNFTIAPLSPSPVVDAEGNAITVTETFASDNDKVVAVTFTNAGDVHAGSVSFGGPGTANLQYTASIKVADQTVILIAKVASFVVTTGAPTAGAVTGGDISFDGLTEEPTPAPAPAPTPTA